MDGKPLNMIVKNVSGQISRWEQRGEFEKTEDFNKRVNKTNRQKAVEKFLWGAFDYFGDKYITLKGSTLGKYDADNEYFPIEIPNTQPINLKVPIDEAATRDNIINEFLWLVKNAKEQDNVLIYYSGHGEFSRDLNKGYWVPVDTKTK